MQPDYWLDTVTRLGDIIREITQKPVTHSRAVSTSARWINGAIHTDLISDFISIHCYYTPELQDADRLRESRWGSGKQILLGEMGAGMDLSRNDRVARYRAVKALVDANPDNVGVLVWSGYDLKDASKPNDQKGLFDKTRRPRADIASEFSAFSITR